PDGRLLATGSGDFAKAGAARVLEAATGKELARVAHDLAGHIQDVFVVNLGEVETADDHVSTVDYDHPVMGDARPAIDQDFDAPTLGPTVGGVALADQHRELIALLKQGSDLNAARLRPPNGIQDGGVA